MVYTLKTKKTGKKPSLKQKKTLTKTIAKKTIKVKAKKSKNPKNVKKVQNSEAKGKVSLSQNHIMPAHVILKKRHGEALTEAEIRYFIEGLGNGTVPEYQMSALAMAICF